MDNNVEILVRPEIYDDLGYVLPPHAEEGYDINGFPVCKTVGAIIDGKIVMSV